MVSSAVAELVGVDCVDVASVHLAIGGCARCDLETQRVERSGLRNSVRGRHLVVRAIGARKCPREAGRKLC